MRTKRRWPWGSSRLALAVVPIGIGAGAMMVVGHGASAQQAATLVSAPQRVIPYASEPGCRLLRCPGDAEPVSERWVGRDRNRR